MRKIILASSSPRRRELLERTGIPFTVEPPDIEEDMRQKISPQQLVMRLALQKATIVAMRHKNAIVIGADTVVALGKNIWSKPRSEREAQTILRALSGKEHAVWTGFCIIDTKSEKKVVRAQMTRIRFRALSAKDINAYIALGESLDAAGGYQLQRGGSVLLEKIVGDYNTVIGLPLAALLKELKKFGIAA